MTLRILHTSDWHLGQHFYGKSRKEEHQAFLAWLLAQVEALSIDVVIVAGDVFDTGTPPSYAREMYFDFAVNMHQLNCPLIVLAGNHDSVAMLTESKSVLAQLGCSIVANASSDINEQVIQIKDEKGRIQLVVCAIPYIRPKDVLVSRAGMSATEKQQMLEQNIEQHYNNVFHAAQELANNQVPIVATGHLTTVGASLTESVRDIYIGTLEAYPAAKFPPADYVALGHIHRHQKVAKSQHIRYSGSPIPLSFDEANQQKVVLVSEFSQNKLSTVDEIRIPCFQPLAMIKTDLNNIEQMIEQLVSDIELKQGQKVWLDIEVHNSQYLSDLTVRVEQLIKDKPIELLLVRRAKQNTRALSEEEENITLDELSLMEVFQAKLAEQDWSSEIEQLRKQRLESLYLQTVEHVTLEGEQEDDTKQEQV